MFEIEIYDKRDPQAIRIIFNNRQIYVLNQHGRLEKAEYVNYEGDMRNVVVLYDPFHGLESSTNEVNENV